MEPDDPVGRVSAVHPIATAIPADAAVWPEKVAEDVVTLALAFPDFYRLTRDPVSRALALTLGDRDLAVEAVDEAMARAYQRWHQVSSFDNPGGWVYRVAFNWATSILRRRHRAAGLPSLFVVVAGDGADRVGEPDVMRAIAELDIRQRSVVVCRYLLGWSEAETAIALSTPIGTVKSRLHRATRRLATRLAHLRPEENS
jgi:RNA polymerase sigma-70 factor (ECF subfamily)